MGRVALATGLGQVIFTSLVGYFLAVALGMEPVAALYVCVALTFSSTIIIVKLLSDKREIDTLHGRIAVGFLIVQDIVVVLVMIGLSAYGFAGASDQLGYTLLLLLLKGAALLAGIALLMRYVLPSLLHYMARSLELVVLFAIAWALFLAILGDTLGFSKEVGTFLAGISLASTRYREAIGTRIGKRPRSSWKKPVLKKAASARKSLRKRPMKEKAREKIRFDFGEAFRNRQRLLLYKR
jgi:Kef-type K+ transport system membrane component KefB